MASWILSLALGALATPPTSPPTPPIFDGTPTTTCQWPTTVTFDFAGCTGTLVSPWIVTTAAHCVGNVEAPGRVLFGDSRTSPSRDAAVEYCRRNPEWDFGIDNGVGGRDFGFCKLVEPIYDVPVTPIVYGCETAIISQGRGVWIVGFGRDADDGESGIKRMGETEVLFVYDDVHTEGIDIGSPEHEACPGDSGGPAYVQYPDGSWHVFGVVSGGPQGCGAWPSTYAAIHAWVPWLEEESGIDVTPCHDADGTWNPTGWCQGFERDPFDDGAWAQMCLGDVLGGSATCGAAFDAIPDGAPPTVTLTSPADATIYDAAPAMVEITIAADDGDGWGVRSVQLEIGGVAQPGALREPPYVWAAQFPQGGYELVAVAEDWAGNIGRSETVRIAVDAELPALPDPGTSTGADDTSGGGSSSDTQGDGDGTSTTGDAPEADGDGGGCGCTTDRRGRRGGYVGAAALLLLATRRARSRPHGA